MIKATSSHKKRACDIIVDSFKDNNSVKYVVKNDSKELKRIQYLVSYSFDVCMESGQVWMDDDQYSCAMWLYQHQKKSNLKSTLRDIGLIFNSVGVSQIGKVLKRESRINAEHLDSKFLYLWYIGVDTTKQGQGRGTQLLQEVIATAKNKNLPLYLETSVDRNIPWYEQHGFAVYQNLPFPNHQLRMLALRP